MNEATQKNTALTLPLAAMRDIAIYPKMTVSVDIGRDESVAAVRLAMRRDRYLVCVMQKDGKKENIDLSNLYEYGTVVKVNQMLQLPGGLVRILVEGVSRVHVVHAEMKETCISAEVDDAEEYTEDPLKAEAYRRLLIKNFFEWMRNTGKGMQEDQMNQLKQIDDPGETADFISSQLLLAPKKRQEILETLGVIERLKIVSECVDREVAIGELESDINQEVRKRMDKEQQDYFLRTKVKTIQDRLGDTVSQQKEAEEYREKLKASAIPEEEKGKLEKEIDHLASMPPMMAETAVARNYLDWVFDLPWGKESEDILDLSHAKEILDEDHYGLTKIKERILEYLAVRVLAPDAKAPIICFVGPPGVGKTSLAQSIARSMGRKFARIALGGVHDEAEIRGHRRTYIGAIPGRIISGMKQAGTMNPVFLFDEIDKMSHDFRGDPASAMLEVLDGEQNGAFRDHYLELPFDLSRVMFITTANSIDTIPTPLLDRMEVIEVPSYTEEEKLQIAKRHLLPKQVKEHGLDAGTVKISDRVMRSLIEGYTREAGVRTLERTIAKVIRKAAVTMLDEGETEVTVTEKVLHQYLGAPRFTRELPEKEPRVGIVNGLAYTTVGGETLEVECLTMPGKGGLRLTGQLGDVMKESAEAAFSYVRAHCADLGLADDFYKDVDIHIHVPEGAVPKDGPSAGVTMATALVSVLTGIPVRNDVAMTGEITLRGRVLPIGGLKEKTLAAYRAGITTLIIPKENQKDLEEIPPHVLSQFKIVCVEQIEQVLENALVRMPEKRKS